ncbi:hypothetical protein D3C81_1045550 [compost metagenome]
MYHCVPKISSGLSQISGFSPKRAISITASGNIRLAGNAARNCATGCATRASSGFRPMRMPIGTHTSAASAISTTTRTMVMVPSHSTWPTSAQPTSLWTK